MDKKKMAAYSPLIKMSDYERIFRVVHSVSSSVGNTAGRACLFYNVIGAVILGVFYNIKARPVMGSAFFCVHEQSATVLAYSHVGDGLISSSNEAFHCWIEAEEYVIDFTAPLYAESLAHSGNACNFPRKMFQRPIGSMCCPPFELIRAGDFFVAENAELSREMLAKFNASPAAKDLANICVRWFTKPPKKINNEMKMIDDLGMVTSIALSKLKVCGAW